MSSAVPPLPGLTADFLEAVRGLSYDPATSSLTNGETLFGPALVQGAAGGSTVDWDLGDDDSPAPTVLLDRATFDVLHGGAGERDGSVLFCGVRYRIALTRRDRAAWCEAVAS